MKNKKLTPQSIYQQILDLYSFIIKTTLSNDENIASFVKDKSNRDCIIGLNGENRSNIMLKNVEYRESYNTLLKKRSFHIKMIDGALISFYYKFVNNEIVEHRLAFLPSPFLRAFQNSEKAYLEDEIYADIVDKRIVTVPIRFDYDLENSETLVHPVSHLTLGQYENCRIPVCSAVTPFEFISFILRNFYNKAYTQNKQNFPKNFKALSFSNSLKEEEKKVFYLNINN